MRRANTGHGSNCYTQLYPSRGKRSLRTVTIDLNIYPLPPVEQILGFLVWLIQDG
ncbi:MAG TPA: hypothetical protein V6D18_21600 [Thermosynechococcaceae cyanobacterium]